VPRGGSFARLRHFFREWREAWEYPEEVPEELFDAGEHVISAATVQNRGRASWGRRRVDSMWSLDDPGGQDRPEKAASKADAERAVPARFRLRE
jgi:hypothetical protein